MNTNHTREARGIEIEAASVKPDNFMVRFLRNAGKIAAVGGFGVTVLDSLAGWSVDATEISDISGIGVGVGILGLGAIGVSSLIGRPNSEVGQTKQVRR